MSVFLLSVCIFVVGAAVVVGFVNHATVSTFVVVVTDVRMCVAKTLVTQGSQTNRQKVQSMLPHLLPYEPFAMSQSLGDLPCLGEGINSPQNSFLSSFSLFSNII